MMVETVVGVPMDVSALSSYFGRLVNRFFKILPVWESRLSGKKDSDTVKEELEVYMHSLQIEILGFISLVKPFDDESILLTLVSALQYLSDNPDVSLGIVRREVFRSINTCTNLKVKYASLQIKQADEGGE